MADIPQIIKDIFNLNKKQTSSIPETILKKDPNWDEYRDNAQKYLDRGVFYGTPLTGDMLSQAAKNIYDVTNTLVPLELALSQGQFESGMGLKGRSPKNNPYNVGEFDEGTKWTYDTTQEGVNAYYNLIAKDYLNNKTLDELLQNFVNMEGNRYASDPNYEKKLRDQIKYINKFLGKE